MEPEERTYYCIDMKTFYASVECAERNLNPFETGLVVADPSRGKNARKRRNPPLFGRTKKEPESFASGFAPIYARKRIRSPVRRGSPPF